MFKMTSKETIDKILRGTSEIIDVPGLKEKVKQGIQEKRPLRIKAGFDPTAPDIHLGHVVLLRKLRQFQDLGHQVYFLIGDFTAQIGDPSGRDQLRPKMSLETIKENAITYKSQVFKILDKDKTKVVFNSKWLNAMTPQQVMELSSLSTVAQMLARADFKKRFEEGREISILEFIYPLLQGYDSYHLKADIELGGTDQKFNLLMGRQIQEALGQKPQVVIMTPLLEGTDGVKKMSKSLGNYIGINEPPSQIFGKVMSINDELMMRYYEVCTHMDLDEVKTLHPKEAKLNLAREIVGQFYSLKIAEDAKAEFERIFSQKNVPDDLKEYSLKPTAQENIIDILVQAHMVASKKEARRLLNEGALSHEGQKISSDTWVPKAGVLKIGKRRFLRLI